jgi:hypothetical protein
MITKAYAIRAAMVGSAALLLWTGAAQSAPLAGRVATDRPADFSVVQPVACARAGIIKICDGRGRRDAARFEHERRQKLRDAAEHERRWQLRTEEARREGFRDAKLHSKMWDRIKRDRIRTAKRNRHPACDITPGGC